VTTNRTYWANSGRLEQINSEIPAQQGQQAQTVENLSYAWDTIGNLLNRDDAYNQVYETFCYNDGANGSEALNRLSNYSVSGTGGNSCTTARPSTA
jgi:hypothetical protein